MDQQRLGEIALAVLKNIVGQDGLRLNSSFRRRLGQLSQQTGISTDELTEFSVFVIEDLTNEFVKKSVKKAQ